MSKPESGRWEQSLRRLAFDLHRCTEEEMYLRANERLVPLLDASLDAIGKSPCGGQCPPDKCEYAKLLEVLESWLTI